MEKIRLQIFMTATISNKFSRDSPFISNKVSRESPKFQTGVNGVPATQNIYQKDRWIWRCEYFESDPLCERCGGVV